MADRAPDPKPGDPFVDQDVGTRLEVQELMLGVVAARRAPSWLVRASDGQLWRLRLRDNSVSRGPRYEGTPHPGADA